MLCGIFYAKAPNTSSNTNWKCFFFDPSHRENPRRISKTGQSAYYTEAIQCGRRNNERKRREDGWQFVITFFFYHFDDGCILLKY